LAGPIMPQPITPIVMRFDAEGRAAHPLRDSAAAAPAA